MGMGARRTVSINDRRRPTPRKGWAFGAHRRAGGVQPFADPVSFTSRLPISSVRKNLRTIALGSAQKTDVDRCFVTPCGQGRIRAILPDLR